MAAALDKEPPTAPGAVDEDDKRRKRRFLWLFLLLPLGGAGYYMLHHGAGSVQPAMVRTTPGTASGSGAHGGKISSGTPAAGSGSLRSPAAGGTISGPTLSAAIATERTISAGKTDMPVASARTARTTDGTGRSHGGERLAGDRGGERLAGGQGGRRLAGGRSRNADSQKLKNDPTSKPDNALSLTAAPGGQWPGGESPVEDRLFYDLRRVPISRDYRVLVNVTAPKEKKDSTAATAKQHKKHFYAGVIGAPDISSVKMQSVKGVGSTFGLLLGYSLNGRWAIESGVYVDRKKYYTDGEYFNTKNVHLPPNADLLDVDGVCYMWEIPVNVRYNFNPGARTAWFATAGLSTYLMSHEKYAYGYSWYGSPRTWDSTWNIHKSSQYPFSIINLSAGFEQRLGKVGNLRVEPYVRLPLTGLGTGKLPIMSAGVNIGITRQLW